MKAVLLSIKPQYCELIANGKKTIEIRKTKPKLKTPFKCYIYETKAINHQKILVDLDGNLPTTYAKGSGKVIGEFVGDYIIGHCESSNADIAEQRVCVKREDIFKYANGKQVFGWHISDLKIYDTPKELSEFYYPPDKYCEKNLCGGCPYDEATIDGEIMYGCEGKRPLIRPPQSWCYVEETKI